MAMVKMFSERNVVIYILIVFCTARGTCQRESQLLFSSRLCKAIGEQFSILRSMLCPQSVKELKVEATRIRRDINVTDKNIQATTQTLPGTTTKRPWTSYKCPSLPINSNGFSQNNNGLNLTVKCTKDKGWWSANISWKIPQPISNKSEVAGYVIRWDIPSESFYTPDPCEHIPSKHITSYVIDSSKGWDGKDKNQILWVAVFPLPVNSHDYELDYRPFIVQECSGGGTTTSPTTTISTSSTSKGSTKINSLSSDTLFTPKGSTKINSSSSDTHFNPNSQTEKKVVAATLVVSGAIVIVTIMIVIYRRRKAEQEGEDPDMVKTGARHYISYFDDCKNITNDVIYIASWLLHQKINVVIDKFFAIPSNKREWRERELSRAERIILLVSPKYLKFCSLDPSKWGEGKKFDCLKDELTYAEISMIKNIIFEKPQRMHTVVCVLVNTKKENLPLWMSQLKCYKYKKNNVDADIIRDLKPSDVFANLMNTHKV